MIDSGFPSSSPRRRVPAWSGWLGLAFWLAASPAGASGSSATRADLASSGIRIAALAPRGTTPGARAERAQLDAGALLIASERLRDPNFARTVVLLIEYDRGGALGVVLNRPTEVTLARLLPDIPGMSGRQEVVYQGGPVAPNRLILLIRAPAAPAAAALVFGETYVSSSLDALERLVDPRGPGNEFHAFAGYAGWSPEQLEGEILRGDWLVHPAAESLLFDIPAGELWPELMRRSAGQWVAAPPRFRRAGGRCTSRAGCR